MTATATQDEAALLARLQNQFGDMNLSSFLQNDNAPQEDDESSYEEPTPEELLKWQEAQYQKGRMELEAKKIQESSTVSDVHKAALLQRRKNKSFQERSLLRECQEEEVEDWEKISRLPELCESSAFFPDDEAAASNELGIHPALHALAAGDPDLLGTQWKRLYSSSAGDGVSFRNLCDRIRGYKGPTVLIVGGEPSASKSSSSSTDNTTCSRVVLGFFTTDYWMESPDPFGTDDDCFLFSIDTTTNKVEIIRPKSRTNEKNGSAEITSMSSIKPHNFLYCHPSSMYKSTNTKASSVFGICIGGSPARPRLHLTESLEECRCLPYDTLFADGDLLSNKCNDTLYYFDVDTLEVWGVGGTDWIRDALDAQAKEREVRESALEKARKVDKRQLLEHFEKGVNVGGSGGLFSHQDFVEERDVDCRIGG